MVSLTGCLHCSFNHCNNNNNNNNNSPPCAHDYREEEKITTTSSDNNEEQQQQQQQVLLTIQITNLSTDDESQRIVVQRQETVALSSLVSEKPFPFVWIPTRQRTTRTKAYNRCNPMICTVSVPRCIVSIPTNLSTRQIPFIPFGAMVCIMLTYILWADNNKTMCV